MLVVVAGDGETVEVTTEVEVVVQVVDVVYLVVGRPHTAGALALVKQMVELDEFGFENEGTAGFQKGFGA